MSEATSNILNDDRIAVAAQRVIDRYRLKQSAASEVPIHELVRGGMRRDDHQSQQAAIDDIRATVERMDALMRHRDVAFTASLERVERLLAKTEGRLDALMAKFGEISVGPAIEIDLILDNQRAIAGATMAEFSGMIDLARVLVDEVHDIHAEIVKRSKD